MAFKANESNFDKLLEGSSASRPKTIFITNSVLNMPLMLTSITGNSLVFAAILRTPSLRSPSFIYLASLAMSDLLVGLIAQPLFITNEMNTTLRTSLLPDLGHVTAFFSCGVSLCTMSIISVDRFMALHYHMRYPALVTIPRAVYASMFIWLTNVLISSVYFWHSSASYLVTAAGVGVCVLISTFCYIRIYQIVRRHQLQIHYQQQEIQLSSNAGSNLNLIRLKRTAINTFVFYIFILLCYMPKFVSLILKSASPHKWRYAWTFANTILFLNSSLNPLLFCWRIRELLTAVLKIVQKIFPRQTVEGN